MESEEESLEDEEIMTSLQIQVPSDIVRRVPPPLSNLPQPPPYSKVDPNIVPGNGSSGERGHGWKEYLFPLSVKLLEPPEIVQLSHSKMLEDEEFCDLCVSFEQREFKNESVLCHLGVLKARCPQLLEDSKYCSKGTVKKGITHISMKKSALPFFSPTALRDLLQWIYAGYLLEIPIDRLLDIANMADILKGDLIWECEHVLRKSLTMDTIHSILLIIMNRPSSPSIERLKTIATSYAFQYWDLFLSNKEAGKKMGIEMLQNLGSLKSKPSTPQSLPNESERPASAILEQYRSMFINKMNTDCAIICDDGDEIECHRAVLIAVSPKFKNLIKKRSNLTSPRSTPRGTAATTPRMLSPRGKSSNNLSAMNLIVDIPKISRTAALAMLQFFYAGLSTFTASDGVFLISNLCTALELSALQSACERAIPAGLSLDNPGMAVEILGLTYIPEIAYKPYMFNLRKESVKFVVDNFLDIDLGPILSVPDPKVRADILFALQKKLREERDKNK